MTDISLEHIEKRFTFLAGANPVIKQELLQYALLKEIPAGEFVCWEGDTCGHLALVLSGSVRVYKVGESGREITLYRIEESGSCILTATCILNQVEFPAIAMVEQTAQALLIPAPVLRRWVEQYDPWRSYVFGLMAARLSDVITTVEEVAFRRVDVRVAEFLAERVQPQQALKITHQEVAYELGTAREVVSRILKDFEREGLIALSRGSVTVLKKTALLEKTQLG